MKDVPGLQSDEKTLSRRVAMAAARENLQEAMDLVAGLNALDLPSKYSRDVVLPSVKKHALAHIDECLAVYAIAADELKAALTASRRTE